MKSIIKAILTTIILIVVLIIMFTFAFNFIRINNEMQNNSRKATEIFLGDGGTE